MDLVGFGYAALVTFGSILGYKRRGVLYFVTLVDLSLSEEARSTQLSELLPSLEIAKKSTARSSVLSRGCGAGRMSSPQHLPTFHPRGRWEPALSLLLAVWSHQDSSADAATPRPPPPPT
nr:transmembrane protein 14A isoform X4 [Equus asinus]XP_044632789.1 transmembrane protein 14A isoform X4 [Equus asinus]